MWHSIQHGPYQRPMVPSYDNLEDQILEPLSKITEGDKKKYIVDVRVMNYILQARPNDIYNSVDTCVNAKEMWERIKRLMHGSDITATVRHSQLMDEFDKFAAKEGESLDSVHERLTTLVNIMDRNGSDKSNKIVQRIPPTDSTLSKENGQCYNCNERVHYACECQKIKVRRCPRCKKIVEELTATVMLMARLQLADGNTKTMPSYDAKAVSQVNDSSKAHEQVSHVKCKTIIQTTDDDQIDSSIIFDDPFVENNGVTSKHDSNVHDKYHEIQMLAYNVQQNGNSWVPIPVTAPESGPSTDIEDDCNFQMNISLRLNQYADAQSMFIAIKAHAFGGNDATKEYTKGLTEKQHKYHDDDFGRNGSNSGIWHSLSMRGKEVLSENRKEDNHMMKQYRAHKKVKKTGIGTEGSSSKAVGLKMLSEKANVILRECLLKRSVGHKDYLMGLVKTELEKVKEEKEGFEFKLAKFEKSSKDLDDLLASLEDSKNLEVNEYGPRDSSLKPTTVCDRESNNSKENTDDSLTQQPKTVSETSSVKSPLKADKAWKEKFFHLANHVRIEEPKKARENSDAPIIEDWVSDDEEEVEPISQVEKKTAIPTATKKESVKTVKPSRRSVRYAEMYRSQRPRGNQRSWNGQKSNQLGCNFVFNNKACFICGNFDHIQYNCPNAHKHMVPRAVLMKTGLKTVTNAQPLSTVSGCSRHMSRNIAHLSDFKEFDGGYVTFGGGANGGRITGKGTEFKNHVMDEFCREKGIKREYSVARIPQQNGVAERKNRTLIEAARTMGIKPAWLHEAIWMSVTNSNTIDKWGHSFDGKSDEGFFVGYSLSSKAFRVYNIRTRKVQENLHVGFLENKPMLEGNGPKWLFDLDSLTQSMNYVPWLAGHLSNVSAVYPEFLIAQHIHSTGSRLYFSCQVGMSIILLKDSFPQIYCRREISTAAPEVNTATPEGLMEPTLTTEDTQVEDQEIELGNISPSYEVSSTPHTRIHKDHPIDHVIGDVQSLFIPEKEPKRISKALSDPAWVKAMQEELLQFKLQNVWVLVDLPKGHRAIGTKWVYRNKKDERGIVVRNKARLVAQGHT
ncbi:putative ribonuclease H-like domain-containing protein [Tanacetum coccineum]|uniref:Ribonuclease H-like domain-containing protein n=1 Tax=Tanacetum coccineum TaxID=301880 RepID=A0ABQ4Z3T4_9ASTR